jgi:hypothetical protein
MEFDNRLTDVDRLQEEISRLRPLRGNVLTQLRGYYKIGLTWASNALEGNSLTESETKVILEDGITVGGKPLRDHFETVGHAEAFDLLFRLAKRRDITEAAIRKLHRLFFYRINPAGHYFSLCTPPEIQPHPVYNSAARQAAVLRPSRSPFVNIAILRTTKKQHEYLDCMDHMKKP